MLYSPFARALLLLALILTLGACQSESASDIFSDEQEIVAMEESVEGSADLMAPAPQSAARGQADASGARGQDAVPVVSVQDTTSRRRAPILIRRADLSLRVDDYVEASGAVPGIVGRFDAYLAGEQESRQSYRVTNTYTIRVAAAEFDSLMAALMDLAADVDSRNVSVDDVTEEFVDVQGRLKARRAVEAQYVTLLARATNVEEVLVVQKELARVREEIESAEGRLRYLQDRASLSTVTLTLYEESPTGISQGPSFFSRLGDAFGEGWEALLGFLVVVVALWPFWLILGAAVWGYRRWRAAHPRTPRSRRDGPPLARRTRPETDSTPEPDLPPEA